MLGARLGKVALLDDLHCEKLFAILLTKFIAACEPTLAEKVALDILRRSVSQQAFILDDEQVLMGCVRKRRYGPADCSSRRYI